MEYQPKKEKGIFEKTLGVARNVFNLENTPSELAQGVRLELVKIKQNLEKISDEKKVKCKPSGYTDYTQIDLRMMRKSSGDENSEREAMILYSLGVIRNKLYKYVEDERLQYVRVGEIERKLKRSLNNGVITIVDLPNLVEEICRDLENILILKK
jgi:hypothetical protein